MSNNVGVIISNFSGGPCADALATIEALKRDLSELKKYACPGKGNYTVPRKPYCSQLFSSFC